jgi:hypothetical protein
VNLSTSKRTTATLTALVTLLLAGCASAGSSVGSSAAGTHLASQASQREPAGSCLSQYTAWLKAGGLQDVLTVSKEYAAVDMVAQGYHLPATMGTAQGATAGLVRAAQAALADMPPQCTKMDGAYATSLRDYIAAATALASGNTPEAERELSAAEVAHNQAITDGRAVDGAPVVS